MNKSKPNYIKTLLTGLIGGILFSGMGAGFDYKQQELHTWSTYLIQALFMGLVFGALNWYEQYRALKKAD